VNSTQPGAVVGVKGQVATERSLAGGHLLNECLVY
jgi:hypothetical protein